MATRGLSPTRSKASLAAHSSSGVGFSPLNENLQLSLPWLPGPPPRNRLRAPHQTPPRSPRALTPAPATDPQRGLRTSGLSPIQARPADRPRQRGAETGFGVLPSVREQRGHGAPHPPHPQPGAGCLLKAEPRGVLGPGGRWRGAGGEGTRGKGGRAPRGPPRLQGGFCGVGRGWDPRVPSPGWAVSGWEAPEVSLGPIHLPQPNWQRPGGPRARSPCALKAR